MRIACLTIIALVAPLSAASAQPKPLAEVRADVDGDGKPDTLRIEDPAALSVRTSRGKSAWKPFRRPQGKLVGGQITVGKGKRFGNKVVIVATAKFKTRDARPASHELLLVEYARGKLRPLSINPDVGPVGRDGEWSRVIEAHPGGLLWYQRKPGVRRCDNQTPYLFPRAYDWRAKKFRSVDNLVRVDRKAPHLVATTTAPAGAPARPRSMTFRIRSTSSSIQAADAGDLSSPVELDDDVMDTVWFEGAGGYGRGELITANSTMSDTKVAAIAIVNGDATSPAAAAKSNRLRRAALLVGDKHAFWIDFPDPVKTKTVGAFAWVVLPKPVTASCVSLIIDSVYPRTRGGRTAITELAVLSELDLSTDGVSMLVKRVTQGGTAGSSAARALAGRGEAGARALLDLLAKRPKKAAALLLRKALALNPTVAAARQLVLGLASVSNAADVRLFHSALVKIGSPGVPAVAELLVNAKASGRARARAAEVLGDIRDPAARVALVAAIGPGNARARAAIAAALARRAGSHAGERKLLFATLGEAIAAGQSDLEATLWHAVFGGRLGRLHAPAIAERLGTANGYVLRHRLFTAAAVTSNEQVVEALRGALAKLGRDQQSIALRRVTVAELQHNRLAAGLIASFLADPDPGVRWRAAQALSRRADRSGKADAELVSRLAKDHWPHVRRAAAAALALRCRRPASARALVGAVDRDTDVEVGRTSLEVLAECKSPGIVAKLFEVAADRKRHTDLRARAVNLIGDLKAPGLRARTIALFKKLRSEAWSRPSGIRLSAAACNALASLGGKEPINTILKAAKDSTFPQLQAGCITALVKRCPREALPIFDRYRASANRSVAIAARSAARACRK